MRTASRYPQSKSGAEPAARRAMDDALYPRFARWLDFLIVLAVGMWCL
jgi:hypothetical protein